MASEVSAGLAPDVEELLNPGGRFAVFGAISPDFPSLVAAAQQAAEDTPGIAARLVGLAADLAASPVHASRLAALADRLRPDKATQIYITGNCTLKPVADMIGPALLRYGVHGHVVEGAFDQWASDMLDENSELYRFAPDFLVVYLSSLGLTVAATREDGEQVGLLVQALRHFRGKSRAQVIVVLPEPLQEEADPSSPWVAWRADAVRMLREQLEGLAIVFDPTPVLVRMGAAAWYAARYWYHGKLPAHPTGLVALGRALAPVIAAAVSRPVKVIACDLDNTLWGGILGEDGWSGVQLDPHGSGAAFLRLQAFLKTLKSRGMVLAAVSKNNRSDVEELFAKRSEMILALEDFAAVEINWDSKSETIRRIAETLNLGLEHICFLDDSPRERAEVRQLCPQVIVPELPAAAEDYVPFLVGTGLFQTPVVTAEDRQRTDYYRRENARREVEAKSSSLSDYLLQLQLVVEPIRIDQDTLERTTQLINKTNQFNLTTRRHGIDEVRRMMADSDTYAYCYKVSDRFGEHGITGVVIARPEANGYSIDTWVLSCRVMGRTVECAVFSHLVDWLRARGVPRLQAEYLPTTKNMPVADLLPKLGGVPQPQGEGRYVFDLSQGFDGNKFVAVKQQDR